MNRFVDTFSTDFADILLRLYGILFLKTWLKMKKDLGLSYRMLTKRDWRNI